MSGDTTNISYMRLKHKTISYFEKEHRYILQNIYNKFKYTLDEITYSDFVDFAYDNTNIDLNLSDLYIKYNIDRDVTE